MLCLFTYLGLKGDGYPESCLYLNMLFLSTYPGGRTGGSGLSLVFEHPVLLLFVQAAADDEDDCQGCDGHCHKTHNHQNDGLLAVR